VLAFELTMQMPFNGIVAGLTYAVFAAGFVLIYRSTGVLNFAQGEIGAFGAALLALFVSNYSIPYWVAFVFAVAICAIGGAAIELSIVRRLFTAPRLVLLIATLGVAQLATLGKIYLPEVSKPGSYPLPFKESARWKVGPVTVLGRDLIVLIVVPVLIIALGLFLTKTRFGLAVRASASNPDTARVFGISVKRTSTIVWTLASGFAAATGIMLAPLLGTTAAQAGTESLGPTMLLRALAVSLIARMRSLPMCLAGGVAIGIAQEVISGNVSRGKGDVVDVYLFIGVLVLVLWFNRDRRAADGWSLSSRIKPVPERLQQLRIVRAMPAFGFVVLFGILLLIPTMLGKPSDYFLWTEIVILSMVTLSLSMLTGWAGQLSLGHFAFVGLGALSLGTVLNGNDIPVPFDLWDMHLTVGWLPGLAIATVVGVVASIIVGIPALRVKGLFLAVTTLAFAVMAQTWMYRQSVFVKSSGTATVRPQELFGWRFPNDRKEYYYFCVLVLGVLSIMVARLRRTGLGRSLIAVRENEDMAAASTVSPTRIKLIAFGISGGIAGLAGALHATLSVNFQPSTQYDPAASIRVVATAVIGGLGSIAGPILGALWTRGLPAWFDNTDQVRLLTSGIGLLILLLYFPGGLMQIVYTIRDGALSWADRRIGDRGPAKVVPAIEKKVPARPARTIAVAEGAPWVATHGVHVRFGGNHAVNDVSVHANRNELVGLIGANGAGKSTLMNAISGFVPSTGRIEVLGHDVSGMAAHRRHRAGLGRGFQSAKLYPDLTVRETIMVALEARQKSLLVPSLTALPPSITHERRKRVEAGEIVDFLGLGRYGDQFIANLSTGTRRIVELGCLLAVDAKVLLLDEPTGGVAQKETEAFGPLIRRIQRELGASMFVIEHDMPLIMSISDRVYCLEAGQVIAEGTPEEVRNNPLVIASYLGTDERAIQRSGTGGAAAPVAVGLVE
jgi:ABC-type branched-subunit amino acid transport system ATPase component/ABC-type branched-subunit amino acid transport system permease subunit